MSNERGKGLNSLLSDSDLPVSQKVAAFGGVELISLDEIALNPNQPRTHFDESAIAELAESIMVHGLIQPITVRSTTGGYELIAGERRLRAAKKAGLNKIPAYVRNVDDQRSIEMALIENLQREDLNPIEVALSYQRMISECQLKQEELGDRVGKKRATVTNYLRLLQLPEEIQSGLVAGYISMGQAKPLISLSNKDLQVMLYHKIVEQGLSSRKVEELVKSDQSFGDTLSPLERYREDMRIEELSLKNKVIVPLKIKVKNIDEGEIVIPFRNEDELKEILDLLV